MIGNDRAPALDQPGGDMERKARGALLARWI